MVQRNVTATAVQRSGVHISKMSGKLEGLRAISTNTVTNPFCIAANQAKAHTICSVCYSHSMLNTYRKNAQAALQYNSDYLSSKLYHADAFPVILDRVFRFSAHGELINDTHLRNLLTIVKKNPATTFALWTKRKDIVRSVFKPNNLVLIFSNPKIDAIMAKPPKGFDKTFNNVAEGSYVEKQNCTGQKCKDCLLCYDLTTTSSIVEKVKNYGKGNGHATQN